MPYGAWITEPKLGLALSGGGHRAAFFHIGVLARLAELELLRPVRVISTVSGGSIVGALYYLHVKALLESTPAGAVTDGHYAEIVAKVARFYDEAQARNVRDRALLDYLHNFRLVTAASPARTGSPSSTTSGSTAPSPALGDRSRWATSTSARTDTTLQILTLKAQITRAARRPSPSS